MLNTLKSPIPSNTLHFSYMNRFGVTVCDVDFLNHIHPGFLICSIRDLMESVMDFFYRLERKMERIFYPKYFGFISHLPKSLNTKKRPVEVIASLTSFPARFEELYLSIESIFRQTYKPDRIILYLDEGIDENTLPEKLLKLKKYGLEIVIGGENIKPHKKYYYAMKEHPDSVIITFDDDSLYRPNVISKLMKSYYRFPQAISCMRAHRMLFDENRNLLPYNSWGRECIEYVNTPRFDLMPTGVGGVLYPPHLLNDELFDIEKIKNLSLNADDVWLKVHELLSHIPAVNVSKTKGDTRDIPLKSRDINALRTSNVFESANDIYLKNLSDYYGFDYYDLVYNNPKS